MDPVRQSAARPGGSLVRRSAVVDCDGAVNALACADAVPGPDPDRFPPALHRRQSPWLLVVVDDSPSSYTALVWALREAARREATVVAVSVLDKGQDADPQISLTLSAARRERRARQENLELRVARATAETGVCARVRTAVIDPLVFEALAGAVRGADLVVVGAHGKTLLRPAVPRPPARRLSWGA